MFLPESQSILSANKKVNRIPLRRIQFKHAKNNPTMAIWLGKQYLGQKDQVEAVIEDKIQVVNDIPTIDEE